MPVGTSRPRSCRRAPVPPAAWARCTCRGWPSWPSPSPATPSWRSTTRAGSPSSTTPPRSSCAGPGWACSGARSGTRSPTCAATELGSRYDEATRTGQAVTFESYYRAYDRWYEIRLFPYDGGTVIFCRDIAERRRAEVAREDLTRTTTSILHALPIPTVLLAADGAIRRANQAWEEIDLPEGSCLAGEDRQLLHLARADDRGGHRRGPGRAPGRPAGARRRPSAAWSPTTCPSCTRPARRSRVGRMNREVHWTQIQATRVDGSDDIVVTHLDVTDRVNAADIEARRARRDDLTGLPNRVRLLEELQARLHDRHVRPLAVLFLDLDGFKTVNDSLGHDVGDQLIRDVAAKLLAVAGEDELLARLGGDEFVLVVEADVAAAAGRGRAPGPAGTLRRRRAAPAALGQRGHRPGRCRSRPPRGRPARRRHRHVRGQGLGPGPQPRVHRRPAGPGPRPARGRRGPGPGAAGRRAGAALPAHRRPPHRRGRRRGGAHALAPPPPRPALPRRLHPRRRGDRPDRRHEPVGPPRGRPPGRGVAGRRARPGDGGQHQRRALHRPGRWSAMSSRRWRRPASVPRPCSSS